MVVLCIHLGLSIHVSVCLTEGHPAADNLGALLHVCEGGDRKTPVCYRTPEVLYGYTQSHDTWTIYIFILNWLYGRTELHNNYQRFKK